MLEGFNYNDLCAKKRIDGEDVFGNKVYCTFGRTSDKESAQRVDCNSKVFQHIQGQSRDRPDAFCGGGYTQNMTTDSSSADLSWRSSVSDNSYSQNFQPFKAYNKTPNSPLSEHQFGSGARTWRNNNNNWRPQMNGSMVGRLEGSPQNEETVQEPSSAQPLYLDKTPESFKKGRSQRVQFRMSSPPSFSFHNTSKSSDIYGQDFRGRSPSPLLWSPIKGTWSPPPSELQQGQVLYGLRDLNIAETSQDGSVLGSQQIPVELQVTNLDQNIDAREMKRILFTIFRDHVMVLHVSVFVQSDGNLAASLRVPSQQDAQYAISQLHRKKIGAKRIIISYVNHNQPSPELKRSKVISLLQEVPGKKLPLFKFRELYERRFHETIGVSEMYNMRDIVTVSDNSTGRMVALHPEFRHLSSPVMTDPAQPEVPENCGSRYCKLHSSGPDESIGWAERDASTSIPNVNIGLRVLAASIHALLESHSGSLPLASLMDCYHADIGPLEEDECGVPLEHLVSCLPGVCIVVAPGGFKYIHWLENKVIDEAEELARSVSPPLVGQLALFSRELVDLLKTFPHCRLLFARFIPAYHHHFGRQCRVADYGFTKLADLFDALPHVVQVLGEGNKRILTLAHKAQTKRFSSDLLRVLKGQPTKSISLEAFPSAYEKALGRIWNIVDYGVCDVEDLLIEVGETIVIVTRTNNETTIAIPKREQTPEEIEKTRQFAAEVVELLRHSPQCKMQFNRFIPAYHHHFGKQCRVADYGFSKLIELFEAIPDVLIVFDDEEDGEKQLQLVERERIKVLGDQVATVVRGAPRQAIRISALSQVFTRYYGYSLRPHQYGANTLEEVIGKLRNHVKMAESGTEEAVVTLVDRGYVHEVLIRARRLLWEDVKCCLSLTEFIQEYTNRYQHPPNLEIIKKDLEDFLIVEGEEEEEEEGTIRLVPLQMFARDLLTLLHEAGGRMLLLNFDTAYLDRFGVACRPAAFGFPNLVALVQSLGDLVAVRGRGAKRILVLNRETAPSPPLFQMPLPQRNNCENNGMYNNYGDQGYDRKPPPPSHLPQPHKVNPSPPMDYQRYIHPQEANTSSPMLVGINPPTPHPSYQPSSPMVYPGSPAPSPGSVMWGQVWSPQYPVMPPLSPAHYMVPTNLLSWGSVAASPPALQCSSSPPTPNMAANIANVPTPISIHTLDELTKQAVGGVCEEYITVTQHEEYTSPPNACELPSPEMLTQGTPVSMVMPVNTPSTCPAPQHQTVGSVSDEGVDDNWSSGNSDADKGEAPTPTNAPKMRTKRRLAAQFISN